MSDGHVLNWTGDEDKAINGYLVFTAVYTGFDISVDANRETRIARSGS